MITEQSRPQWTTKTVRIQNTLALTNQPDYLFYITHVRETVITRVRVGDRSPWLRKCHVPHSHYNQPGRLDPPRCGLFTHSWFDSHCRRLSPIVTCSTTSKNHRPTKATQWLFTNPICKHGSGGAEVPVKTATVVKHARVTGNVRGPAPRCRVQVNSSCRINCLVAERLINSFRNCKYDYVGGRAWVCDEQSHRRRFPPTLVNITTTSIYVAHKSLLVKMNMKISIPCPHTRSPYCLKSQRGGSKPPLNHLMSRKMVKFFHNTGLSKSW